MHKPLVSVVVITYNQEKYIGQALDSILMQKTDFPIEILIGDDCSDDNTPNIVKRYEQEYPSLIKAFCREENLGSTRNSYELYMRAKGKYIANLEGDDYWIDDKKLQKQVDFLEANLEYACCCADFVYVDYDDVPFDKAKADKLHNSLFSNKREYALKEFNESKHPSHPGTWVFRNFFASGGDYSILYKAHKIVGDTTLIVILITIGKFYRLPANFLHYRMVANKDSSWTAMCEANPFHLYELFKYHVCLENYARDVLHINISLIQRKQFEFYHFADNYLRNKTRAKRNCLWNMFRITKNKSIFLKIYIQAIYLARLSGNVRNMYPLSTKDRLYQELNKTWDDFKRCLSGRRLILYGAGGGCLELLAEYYDVLPVDFIVDKSVQQQGKYILGYKVYPPEKLNVLDKEKTLFLITSPFYYKDIAAYLQEKGFCNYFSFPVMERKKFRYWPLRFFDHDMDYLRS